MWASNPLVSHDSLWWAKQHEIKMSWSGGSIWLIPNPRSNGCECHFHAPTILSQRMGQGSSTYWKGAMTIPHLIWTWCCRGKSIQFYAQTPISQSIVRYFIKWVNHSPQGFATEYLKTVRIKAYVWRYYYLPGALQSIGIILRGIAL